MGSTASMQLQAEELEEISKETGFTTNQVKRLYSRFTSLDKDNTGYLDKTDFERIPELHVNPMRDRILEVLINDNGKLYSRFCSMYLEELTPVFFFGLLLRKVLFCVLRFSFENNVKQLSYWILMFGS